MILGYNTNGFAHHRLTDAVEIVAELGYGGVALTFDVNHIDPYRAEFPWQVSDWRERVGPHGLDAVLETGARYLLDTRRKHQPTLLDPDTGARAKRADFIRLAAGFALELHSSVVSFWSGAPPEAEIGSVLMDRLVDGCRQLADYAATQNVRLAFEPEPGMFIDTMDKFAELHARVNHPAFGLTLDVGHLVCLGETPIGDHIRRWRDWLWNVHLDDMRPGVHDHLMFGEGAVDFADVFGALREIGYAGMASVELSRHSHDAVNTARRSMEFLRPFV